MNKKLLFIGLVSLALAMSGVMITIVPIIGSLSLVINLIAFLLAICLILLSIKQASGKAFAVIVLIISLASAGFGVWSNFIQDKSPQKVDWEKVDHKLDDKVKDTRPKGDSLNKQMDDLEKSLGN
jgi:hypothetical protein